MTRRVSTVERSVDASYTRERAPVLEGQWRDRQRDDAANLAHAKHDTTLPRCSCVRSPRGLMALCGPVKALSE